MLQSPWPVGTSRGTAGRIGAAMVVKWGLEAVRWSATRWMAAQERANVCDAAAGTPWCLETPSAACTVWKWPLPCNKVEADARSSAGGNATAGPALGGGSSWRRWPDNCRRQVDNRRGRKRLGNITSGCSQAESRTQRVQGRRTTLTGQRVGWRAGRVGMEEWRLVLWFARGGWSLLNSRDKSPNQLEGGEGRKRDSDNTAHGLCEVKRPHPSTQFAWFNVVLTAGCTTLHGPIRLERGGEFSL